MPGCPTGEDLGALLLADADVVEVALLLPPGDQRAHLGGRVQRVADRQGARRGGEGVGELVVAGARQEDAGLGDARLAVVHPGRGSDARHGRLQIRVRQDDGRGLAAEFERHAGEVAGGHLHHALAGRDRPGEGDLVDARVPDQVLADVPVGGQDRQHALRQPGLAGDLAEQIGVERGLGRRLEDDRAAGEQRGGELGGGDELRDVPGDHGGHDPDGLPPHEDPAEHAVAPLLVGEVPGDGDRRVPDHHRAEGLGEDAPGVRRAVLGGDHAGDLVMPDGDGVLDPAHDLDPLVEAHTRPGPLVERPPRRRHGPVHISRRGVRDASDDLLGVRRDHLDDVLAQGVGQLPADEQLSVFHELGHGRLPPRERSLTVHQICPLIPAPPRGVHGPRTTGRLPLEPVLVIVTGSRRQGSP